MAVIWLNQNTTDCLNPDVYDSWDEINETIIPLGRQPQSGDFVYLNSHTIKQNVVFSSSINVTISNETNPYTGIGGGYIDRNTGRSLTIYGNINGSNNTVVRNTNYGGSSINIYGNITGGTGTVLYNDYNNSGYISLTIVGDVVLGSGVLMATNTRSSANITGNVETPFNYIFTGGLNSLVVNGNIYTHKEINNNTTNSLTINGNLLLTNTPSGSISTFLMNGEITFDGYKSYVSATNLTINGNIKYRNREALQLISSVNNITILNAETFKASELVNNETITHLLTNYDLNNTQQYPTPANVKKDIPYAWGELVGQYLPDYPPETVVLKDYAYDGGEMVGTLENEVTVTNTNTINVYPYKKRQ
jgi:hypothetical protein